MFPMFICLQCQHAYTSTGLHAYVDMLTCQPVYIYYLFTGLQILHITCYKAK